MSSATDWRVPSRNDDHPGDRDGHFLSVHRSRSAKVLPIRWSVIQNHDARNLGSWRFSVRTKSILATVIQENTLTGLLIRKVPDLNREAQQLTTIDALAAADDDADAVVLQMGEPPEQMGESLE